MQILAINVVQDYSFVFEVDDLVEEGLVESLPP